MYLYSIFSSPESYVDPKRFSPEQNRRHEETGEDYLRQIAQGNAFAHSTMALHLMHRKSEQEQCLYHCEQTLKNPKNGNSHGIAYYAMAGLQVSEGNLEKAVEILKAGLADNPNNDFICKGLSYLYYHLQEFDNALGVLLPQYEEFREDFFDPDEPDDAEFCESIGLCYAQKGEYETAISWFKRGLEDTHYEYLIHRLHYFVGQCWQDLGDDYRALAAYKKAIELKSDMPEVYNNLGAIAYNSDGNIREAIAHIEKALEWLTDEDDLSITVWKNLKMLYNKIADYDKAEYCKYKMLCAMGFGDFFAYGPVEDSEDEDDEDEEGRELESM